MDPAPALPPAPAHPPALARARAVLLLGNLLLAAVLTVSGLLLLASYRPGSSLATLHRQTGRALVATVALSLLLHLVSRPRPALVATTAGLLAAAVAALASGPLVAWRELAIWGGAAAEAGRTSFSGHLWLLGGDVRFAVVNSNELEPSTMAALLGVHLGAAAVTAAIAIGTVILQGRPPTSSGGP